MHRRNVSFGGKLESIVGYSRAVVCGNWCFLAGTTGFDQETQSTPEGIGDQIKNAFSTAKRALAEAGFAFEDVVRVTYYVTETGIHDEIVPLFGDVFGDVRPAATYLEVSGLAYPELKFEVEITALKG
jgi:enamine deaminase RidA (YjgF/YER057c/UK114 family)